MLLEDALNGVSIVDSHFLNTEVLGVDSDSRQIRSGFIFVCLKGENFDGNDFINEALRNGASAIISSRKEITDDLRQKNIAYALVEDANKALWRVAKNVYENPSVALKVVGITGTNGKTTTAWILSQMLNELGFASAYLGTLGVNWKGEMLPLSHTTAFPSETQRMLRFLHDDGAEYVVMEVSSHALSQKRIDGVEFDVAVFTNLTQDHLDFHSSIEDYFMAKRRLFFELPTSKKIITVANNDDEFGRKILQDSDKKIGFGFHPTDLQASNIAFGSNWLKFNFSYLGKDYEVAAKLGGRFNIENCLSAIGGAIALGIDPAKCASVMSDVMPAPGRFESVSQDEDFSVIVDYAHTPDALEKLLSSVRELKPNRVITVFGCGGDRDRTKRPKMGNMVSKYSDISYVTSDNPRTEDPNHIIEDILPGMNSSSTVRVEVDRASAIKSAIEEAQAGDIVVIAGKGHEDYQILGKTKVYFDDRVVAKKAIQEKVLCK